MASGRSREQQLLAEHPLEKYYRNYTYFLKKKFGAPILRISLNGGFTCPNRDGNKGTGGCIYCSNESFSPVLASPLSIGEQIDYVLAHTTKVHRYKGFIAYFQPYSNTYAPPEKLEKIYRQALGHEKCLGLALGTRPDCVPDAVLDLLEDLAKKYFVTVEYGLQSVYEESLRWIGRGHSYGDFLDAVKRTAGRNILIGSHIILGLPGETEEMMLRQARILSDLPIDILKIHQLQIVKNTLLEKIHEKTPLKLWTEEEYSDFIIRYIGLLRPDLILQRLFSNTVYGDTAAPLWSKKKLINLIRTKLEKGKITQGCLRSTRETL